MNIKPEGVPMNASPSPSPSPSPQTIAWQPDKMLGAHDQVLFLTGVEREFSRYKPWSKPQELFKVGMYDLVTEKISFARFGRDIAFALVKAGIAPQPWNAPQPFGVEIHRAGHPDENKGRQYTWAILIDLEPSIIAVAPIARRTLLSVGHYPNLPPGAWADLEERAKRELAIEAAALAMVGAFSAADVRAAIGDPNAAVTYVLQRLVREGRLLPPTGKKRGTRYQVAPPSPLIERVDWTD